MCVLMHIIKVLLSSKSGPDFQSYSVVKIYCYYGMVGALERSTAALRAASSIPLRYKTGDRVLCVFKCETGIIPSVSS